MTIKPNTMCMIRGVPQGMPGGDCNGKIVQAKELIGSVWRFEPAVHTTYDRKTWSIDLSEPRYLHPLDDFEDELSREALDLALERTFRETLERELKL